MQPLKPVKPTEKLPFTYHLTVVKVLEKGEREHSVVLTEMQGDEVKRRKVMTTEPNLDLTLDALNRIATRVYYFGEGAELIAP